MNLKLHNGNLRLAHAAQIGGPTNLASKRGISAIVDIRRLTQVHVLANHRVPSWSSLLRADHFCADLLGRHLLCKSILSVTSVPLWGIWKKKKTTQKDRSLIPLNLMSSLWN